MKEKTKKFLVSIRNRSSQIGQWLLVLFIIAAFISAYLVELELMLKPNPQSLEETPILVEEDYKGFDIISYKGGFYGLARTLEPVNLTQLDESRAEEYRTFCNQTGQCVIASSLEEVKRLVTELAGREP